MRMLPRGLVAVLLVFLGASPRNACALSIRTPAPHLLSLPPRLPRVVDWSELHREQARLAPPRSKLEEERDFFRELFQEVLGRDQGVPVMFEELVGGNQDRGVGVGMGWAGDGAMAARPTVAPRHGVHSEFYATAVLLSPDVRHFDVVYDSAAGDLWIVEGRWHTAIPEQARARRIVATPSSAFNASTLSSTVRSTSPLLLLSKVSGHWEPEIVSSVLDLVRPQSGSLENGICALPDGEVSSSPLSFGFEGEGSTRLVVAELDRGAYEGDFLWITPETAAAEWPVVFEGFGTTRGTTWPADSHMLIDPGTAAFAILPFSEAAAVHDCIPNVRFTPLANDPGFYSFLCDATPSLSVHLEGFAVPVVAGSLNLGRVAKNSRECVSGIVGHGLSSRVLGQPFLSNLYTIFDPSMGRVGLARRSATSS